VPLHQLKNIDVVNSKRDALWVSRELVQSGRDDTKPALSRSKRELLFLKKFGKEERDGSLIHPQKHFGKRGQSPCARFYEGGERLLEKENF